MVMPRLPYFPKPSMILRDRIAQPHTSLFDELHHARRGRDDFGERSEVEDRVLGHRLARRAARHAGRRRRDKAVASAWPTRTTAPGSSCRAIASFTSARLSEARRCRGAGLSRCVGAIAQRHRENSARAKALATLRISARRSSRETGRGIGDSIYTGLCIDSYAHSGGFQACVILFFRPAACSRRSSSRCSPVAWLLKPGASAAS